MPDSDIKELATEVRRVADAMISMRGDQESIRKEVSTMVGRVVDDLKRLFQLVRDGGEGRRALVEQVQDCQRDLVDLKASRAEFRQEVQAKFQEIEKQLEAIQLSLSTGTVLLGVEKIKGRWVVIASLVTAAFGCAAAILIALLK